MKELLYEYRELAMVFVALVFYLGNYIEFRSNKRRDIAIAGNAFVTVALVVIAMLWDRVGAWRWLIAFALGLAGTLITVALYRTSSNPDHLRAERRSGGSPSNSDVQGPS